LVNHLFDHHQEQHGLGEMEQLGRIGNILFPKNILIPAFHRIPTPSYGSLSYTCTRSFQVSSDSLDEQSTVLGKTLKKEKTRSELESIPSSFSS
jgi:hypothetical protein